MTKNNEDISSIAATSLHSKECVFVKTPTKSPGLIIAECGTDTWEPTLEELQKISDLLVEATAEKRKNNIVSLAVIRGIRISFIPVSLSELDDFLTEYTVTTYGN